MIASIEWMELQKKYKIQNLNLIMLLVNLNQMKNSISIKSDQY